MNASTESWAEQIRSGDARALARALSAVENGSEVGEQLITAVYPYTGRAYRIGITGAPGTGKSTLVDRLAAGYRAARKTVGIIAVDPTSPFTGGAILGDRVRMQGQAGDPGIFIRSMATRGHLGGLAQSAAEMALMLDAAGKDIVLIETVGVGQGEVEIVRFADCTVVVLTPGMGDDIQNLKAGLMEIGDIFVLNKCDREGAQRFEQQLNAMLRMAPARDGWKPCVVRTVATEGKGVAELMEALSRFRENLGGEAGGETETEAGGAASRDAGEARERRAMRSTRSTREVRYWKEWILRLLQGRLLRRVSEGIDEERLEKLAWEVAARKRDPYTVVREILGSAGRVEGKS